MSLSEDNDSLSPTGLNTGLPESVTQKPFQAYVITGTEKASPIFYLHLVMVDYSRALSSQK